MDLSPDPVCCRSARGSRRSICDKATQLAQNILTLIVVGNVVLRCDQSSVRIVQTILEHLLFDAAAALIHLVAELVKFLINLIEALNGVDEICVVLLEHLVGLVAYQLSCLEVLIRDLYAERLKLVLGTLRIQLIRQFGLGNQIAVAAITAETEVSACEDQQREDPEERTTATPHVIVPREKLNFSRGHHSVSHSFGLLKRKIYSTRKEPV